MATNLQHSPRTSPNKRVKTLTSNPDQSPPPLLSKGKSIIQEGMSLTIQQVQTESADCCGICLLDAGNGGVSRGFIDSCNHYFCFVCIMEWAKVESKCPLCKRRFSTIRRPPKPPIFISDRVVHIPVRDQVYHYFGNATVGPPNPYSEVKCNECHGKADESFLLLCDLCDSAAHTYCVGLGVTVPEGDWFCPDCSLLRDEFFKSESITDSGPQIRFETVEKKSSTNENVSVFDIVREPIVHAVQISGSASSDPFCSQPHSSSDDETIVITDINQPNSTSITQHPTMPNARTLRHCRDLHDRIRVLRENWNEFRSGTFRFSSNPGDGNISNQKSVTSQSGRHSTSYLNQQSKAHGSSSHITNDFGTHEILKAWKMMDKAKSIEQDHKRSRIVSQASKCPIRKLNTIRNDADFMSYRHLSTDSQQNGSKNVGSLGPRHHYYYSLEKNCYKQPSSVSGKHKFRIHTAEDVTNCSEGSITGHSLKLKELKSPKGVQNPSYLYNASVRSEKLPAEKSFKESACLGSSVVSEPVPQNIDQVKGINGTYSSLSNGKPPKGKSKLEKIGVDSKKYDEAKSEIQSLVKLNLKLQTKEEKLDVDAYKEVAWLATHSILGACGLEHRKPGSCSIPDFMCSHSDEVRQLHKFSLMPNSCRECFYVFVRDIVNTTIMWQKTKTPKKI